MLTEQFIASVGNSEKPQTNSVSKDANIVLHEYQPLVERKAIYKNSATPPRCLAINRTHVFAAQADKSVVHVYNRGTGKQESVVPFSERVTCITLASDGAILVLGTMEGRIFLWETASGRQVSTEQSHLQKLTALAVDGSSNFLLSASADSTTHVWSLPSLLSFGYNGGQTKPPLCTFTSHRTEISTLIVGHSTSFCNFAITASTDRTCFVWDFHTCNVLRTYLLSSQPLCSAIDAADRTVYFGYNDGSIQHVDLLVGQETRLTNVQNADNAAVPFQPSKESIWRAPGDSYGAVLSIDVSFDSYTVITGHDTGKVLAWDVSKGAFRSTVIDIPLPGPVTNLSLLPISGLLSRPSHEFSVPAVIKPKLSAFGSSNGGVPGNYALHVELLTDLNPDETALFDGALTDRAFSVDLLDEGLSELASWGKDKNTGVIEDHTDTSDDFMALDQPLAETQQAALAGENATLKAELLALRNLQRASFDKIEKINAENKALIKREKSQRHKFASRAAANHEEAIITPTNGVTDTSEDED